MSSSDPSSPDELASYQKTQLAKQVQAQRSELKDAYKRQEELCHARDDAEKALNEAASVWASLEDDLKSLSKRVGSKEERGVKRPAEEQATIAERLLNFPSKAAKLKQKEEEAHDESPAKFLKGRKDDAVQALENICNRIDSIEQQLSSSNVPEGVSATNEHMESLRAEATRASENEKRACEREQELQKRCTELEHRERRLALDSEEAKANAEQLKRTLTRLQTDAHGMFQHCSHANAEKQPANDEPRCKEIHQQPRTGSGDGTVKKERVESEPADAAEGESEKKGHVLAQSKLVELEEKVQKREEESAKLRQQLYEKQKECRQLHDAFYDEGMVIHSENYKAVSDQLTATANERDQMRDEKEAMQSQLDQLRREQRENQRKAEVGENYIKQNETLQKRVQELEKRVNTLADERDSAKQALEYERSSRSETRTVKEMQAAMEQLEADVRRAKDEAERHKGAVEELEGARREASEAKEAKAQKEGELERAKEQLSQREWEAPSRVAALERERDELKLFVEITQGLVESHQAKEADIEAKRRAADEEVNKLRAELDKLRQAGERGKTEEAERRATAAERMAEEAQKGREEVGRKLSAKEQEAENLAQEIANVAAAYEEAQGQNGRLLQQMAGYDSQLNDATGARIAAQQEATRAREDRDKAREEVNLGKREVEAATERATALEQRLARSEEACSRLHEEKASLQAKLDEVNARVTDATALHRALRGAQEQNSTLSSRSRSELQELEQSKAEISRLKDDLKAAETRVESAARGGERPSVTAEEELAAYRRMFVCQVCNSRPRAVVIARCFHLFCRECVQSSISSRHRKCPACAQPFSASDVNDIYF